MIKTTLIAIGTVAIGVALAQPASPQGEAQKLGAVHFETSCSPQAQKLFDQGMLYQHSFWYRASQKVFEDTLKADPECGIAYWGIALSLLLNPHVPPPAKNLAEGAAAIAKAESSGAKTQRERDYLERLRVMYADHDKVDHRTRILAYAKAMEQLAQRYPNDDEAQIHYALALNTSASPADKTYANQLKGAAILEPIFKRQPQHPGVAHYLIHLYDYPPIAEKGLEAARLYAKIAPGRRARPAHAVAHLHACRLLAGVDRIEYEFGTRRQASRRFPRPAARHGLPGLRLPAARPGHEGQGRPRRHDHGERLHRTFLPGPYALAVSPARYAIERGDWKAAAALAGSCQPAAARAGDHSFRAALGAARSGDPDAAKADIAKLGELRDKLVRPRTPTGPSRSTSRSRSPPPRRRGPNRDGQRIVHARPQSRRQGFPLAFSADPAAVRNSACGRRRLHFASLDRAGAARPDCHSEPPTRAAALPSMPLDGAQSQVSIFSCPCTCRMSLAFRPPMPV